jgi:8-oxo-dGTP diphosphatase
MPTTAVEIETRRLKLRRPRPADAVAVADQVNDWDVVRYTASIPYPYDRGMADAFIASQERRWADWSGTAPPAEEVAFSIERQEDAALVGCIGLQPAEQGDGVEFGYWIGKQHWGRGYASEAVAGLARFAFEQLHVAAIWAAAVPLNDASHRVLEKNGFAITAAGERASDVRGHALPVIIRRLTRAQWAAAQATVV